MGLLSIFGFGAKRKEKIREMLNNNGLIVDVRSKMEFDTGNVKGSVNVPLESLKHKTSKLKNMKRPLVLVCRSGARSGTAAYQLSQEGIECINGGRWKSFAS